MKRAYVVSLLLACLVAMPAFAASRIDVKGRSKMKCDSHAETGAACERGTVLGARVPDDVQGVMAGCPRDTEDAGRAAACRRGAALGERLARQMHSADESSFSYTRQQGRGAAQVEVGDYRVVVGDAEKSIDDCMQAFESSSTPPSCLSGITVQRKPPVEPPTGSRPR